MAGEVQGKGPRSHPHGDEGFRTDLTRANKGVEHQSDTDLPFRKSKDTERHPVLHQHMIASQTVGHRRSVLTIHKIKI